MNDINSYAPDLPEYTNPFYDPNHEMDPLTRRQLMTASYYDFSLPWNLGFNYSMSYTNNGIRKRVSQTLGFNGSFSPTPKWGVTFSGGYDYAGRGDLLARPPLLADEPELGAGGLSQELEFQHLGQVVAVAGFEIRQEQQPLRQPLRLLTGARPAGRCPLHKWKKPNFTFNYEKENIRTYGICNSYVVLRRQ